MSATRNALLQRLRTAVVLSYCTCLSSGRVVWLYKRPLTLERGGPHCDEVVGPHGSIPPSGIKHLVDPLPGCCAATAHTNVSKPPPMLAKLGPHPGIAFNCCAVKSADVMCSRADRGTAGESKPSRCLSFRWLEEMIKKRTTAVERSALFTCSQRSVHRNHAIQHVYAPPVDGGLGKRT